MLKLIPMIKEKINFLEIELEIKKKDMLLNFIKNKL